jgi:hypothetical protein
MQITVGSAKNIQINRGGHEGCGAARVLCKTHSATKMQILFLNLFAMVAQRNDLAVLSNGFDRSPATLIR